MEGRQVKTCGRKVWEGGMAGGALCNVRPTLGPPSGGEAGLDRLTRCGSQDFCVPRYSAREECGGSEEPAKRQLVLAASPALLPSRHADW